MGNAPRGRGLQLPPVLVTRMKAIGMTETSKTWAVVSDKFAKTHRFHEDQVQAFATQAA
jgi:hypothetical protein